MAEEAVGRKGEEENQEINNENKPNLPSSELSIIVNTSAIDESKSSDEFKHGFSLCDLYKLGLEFYKKGKSDSEQYKYTVQVHN